MSVNRISSALSVADRLEVMDLLSKIDQKLSFLIDVGPEERKSMAKMGDRNRAFASKALDIATQNPSFLPRSFDLAEMRRDLELYDALQPVLLALTRLQELVDDTAVAAGNEAYCAALEIYRYAKANGNVAGLDNWIGEMGQRFAQQSSRSRGQTTEQPVEG